MYGQSLDRIVSRATELKEVRKADLRLGDSLYVTTLNSVYQIRVLQDGRYAVSGGWFDRKGLSPLETTITGCTWGGSIIKLDTVAACGLCLEFGNRVVTSIILKVHVVQSPGEN
jgi:hypothetical protein